VVLALLMAAMLLACMHVEYVDVFVTHAIYR